MKRGKLIRARLFRVRRAKLVNDLVALLLLAIGLAAFGVAIVAFVFWSGWVVLIFAVPVAWFGWRWLRGLSIKALARDVEKHFPEVQGKLVPALELAEYRPDRREGYSEELIQAAVSEVEKAVAPLALGRLVRRRRILWSGLGAIIGLAVFFGFLNLARVRAQIGLQNAFSPSRVPVEFIIEPGDTTVLPGSEIALNCRIRPAGIFRYIVFERSGEERQRRKVGLEPGGGKVIVRPKQGFSYCFRLLSRKSEDYQVQVIEPLSASRIVFVYRYPDYTGLPEYRSTSPEIVALHGTIIEFEGRVNRPVEQGRLVFSNDTIGLAIKTDSLFSGRFRVRGDAEGRIELLDVAGGTFQPVELVRVQTVSDEPPMVKLFMPGRDVDLPMSMKVILGINSLDDFGLSALYLHYGKDSVFERTRLKLLGNRREDTTLYTWDLSGSGLLPGDVMRYYVAVTDNDEVMGHKQSRTDVYEVRFPTMTEIYNASVRQTERTTDELAPIRDAQKKIDKEIARINDQMKKEGKLSWEERKALEQVLADQSKLANEIGNLRKQVEQLTDELFQGMALDKETMKRMGQLQELLSKLLPRELQESLAKLHESLGKESPDLRKALSRFQINQKQLKASIDRAVDFLKRVVEEQRLEALARKANDLAKTQNAVLEKLGKEKPEVLTRLERQIGAGIDSLAKEMASLSGTMSDSAIGDSLARLGEQMAQDSLSQLAAQTGDFMQQGNNRQAKSPAGKLAQRLKQLGQSLSSLSQRLKRKRSAEVANKLRGSAEELLMLSEKQEGLEAEARKMRKLDSKAAYEMGLHDGTGVVAESLASLGSRTMSLPSRLIGELVRSMGSMQDAAQNMIENRSGPACQHMAQARTGMNRAVVWILSALEQAQQGGGMSGGMESLMEQLSQMTAEQMAINAGMNGIPIPIPGGLSPAQMQALSRLLGRQSALREQLEQMLQSMGGERPGLTSSLESLVDEMKSVERDMAKLNVHRDLVERQEDILSHLLDAQRSIRQKGFKQKRKSQAAKPFQLGPNPRLPEDFGERNRLLREELMRALKQGDFGDYEPMIRAYFERLLTNP